ncbi:MAG: endonuclease III [Acetobacter sp.]|nr:endonuclease III [Acetobacter sp.]
MAKSPSQRSSALPLTPASGSRKKGASPKTTARKKASSPSASASAKPAAPDPKALAPRNMTHEELLRFLGQLAKAWPDAETELVFASPFQLLIATLMAAQATDAAVNRATPALFARAPGPAEMAKLHEDDVGEMIRTIGLWRHKAKNIIALSRILMDDYDGEVPRDRTALEALPGVGRKTAAVVMNVAFEEPAMPVDTHCFRLANRTGLALGKNVLEVELALEKRIPRNMLREAHHWLILQGRYVCKARKPECWRCVAQQDCLFPNRMLMQPSS